jgi:hypothetical protein
MTALPPRRRGGPVWIIGVDLIRNARWGRNWLLLVLVVLIVVAVLSALAAQTVVPWVIYPAL